MHIIKIKFYYIIFIFANTNILLFYSQVDLKLKIKLVFKNNIIVYIDIFFSILQNINNNQLIIGVHKSYT